MQFSSENLLILNVILAFMMFGVSLSLTGEDFRRVLKRPDAPIVGLLAQFVLLPAATCLTTWFFEVDPEMALGMILVASCPGGSFSNIMTWLARANVARDEIVSQASEKLNRRVYVLTIIAALFLPLSVLTGVFGMNVGGMPLASHPHGFLIVSAAFVVLLGFEWFLLRYLRWW